MTRGKDYTVLKRAEVQTRLHLPAYQQFSRPESALVRTLYDCPDVAVGLQGQHCRVVVATHPAGKTKSRIGHTCKGIVYELFFTNLPQSAFTAADVVALYLHRGADLPQLADEDEELDPDRWCSHAPAGQEAWQIVSQWVWNLRLELGHRLEPSAMRTTEFAPAVSPTNEKQAREQGYGKPVVGGSKDQLDASRERTLPFSQMGPCAVQLANPSWPRSSAENKGETCVSSMRPGWQIVAAVGCGRSVSGTASIRSTRVG